MRLRLTLLTSAALLLVPASALASLADEQRQGGDLLAQLQSGAKTCKTLSAEDFDHIGEYVMGRTLGSIAAHQAMNDRMRLMLGARGEQLMHQAMGQRVAGCSNGPAGNGVYGMMGRGMMGGSYGQGGWRAMMSSGAWSWMMGGHWRNMSRQNWQRLERQWLGAGANAGSDHGWSAGAIVATTLGAVLLAALAIVAIVRRPFRRPPAPAS